MQLLQPLRLEATTACPYLPARLKQHASFMAGRLSATELSALLAAGWRKFGRYYFRPACSGCRDCTPLRVQSQAFAPSRSQRRLLRRSTDLRVVFGPLRQPQKAFALYRAHVRGRFGAEEPDFEDFLYSFYLPSCPCLQSEVYLGETLVGVGFLDRGVDCLSSVYFCYDPRHAALRLGTYSILQEIAFARRLGLRHYYLGYHVPACRSLDYKDAFRPREHYGWRERRWRLAADQEPASS